MHQSKARRTKPNNEVSEAMRADVRQGQLSSTGRVLRRKTSFKPNQISMGYQEVRTQLWPLYGLCKTQSAKHCSRRPILISDEHRVARTTWSLLLMGGG